MLSFGGKAGVRDGELRCASFPLLSQEAKGAFFQLHASPKLDARRTLRRASVSAEEGGRCPRPNIRTEAARRPPAGNSTFDADLNFLSRWDGPLGLLALAMLAYTFIVEGVAFFHTAAEQAIQLQKNIAVAGGFLALALLGPGAWSLDGWRGRAV